MTKRRVWRYKCDFCKKSNCSPASITKHERGCTKNPERVCGMCEATWPRPELTALLADVKPFESGGDGSVEIGEGEFRWWQEAMLKAVGAVEDAADQCPACTLTAIVQSGLGGHANYDYAGKCKAWWAENDAYASECAEWSR